MDLIDSASAEKKVDTVVKLSCSPFSRRGYSSITDVLDSFLRTDLNHPPTSEEREEQSLKLTQLLAEECKPDSPSKFERFAFDCTSTPRIYAKKVSDRGTVHSPNHVPGQKPITVGHQYSVAVYLPSGKAEQKLDWVVPLTIQRVKSDASGSQVGLAQLKIIVNQTAFKDSFCVFVSDAAYSTRRWAIEINQYPNAVHIARMRGNRKVYRMPALEDKPRGRGRPLYLWRRNLTEQSF